MVVDKNVQNTDGAGRLGERIVRIMEYSPIVEFDSRRVDSVHKSTALIGLPR